MAQFTITVTAEQLKSRLRLLAPQTLDRLGELEAHATQDELLECLAAWMYACFLTAVGATWE